MPNDADGWVLALPTRSTGRYVSISLKNGRFRVSVSPAIMRELDWGNQRIGVEFGTGANRGKLRIAPSERGYAGHGVKNSKDSLNLPVRYPVGLRENAPSKRAAFEIADGVLIVTLPDEYLAE